MKDPSSNTANLSSAMAGSLYYKHMIVPTFLQLKKK